MFILLIIAFIIVIRCIAAAYTMPDAQDAPATAVDADRPREEALWFDEWSGGAFRSVPILGDDGLLENIDGTPYMG